MALPAEMILESQEHAYYTRFRSKDIKFSETRASFLVTFLLPHRTYPRSAFMKIYRKDKVRLGLLEAQRLQTASSLSPAVQRCLYSFQHEDEVYVFLEYCPRGSLKDKIRRRNGAKMWKESTLLHLFASSAEGLRQLHAGVFPHGRIKARNIFFTQDKDARFGGFSVKNVNCAAQSNDFDVSKMLREDLRRLCATFLETAACRLIPASGSLADMKGIIRERYSEAMAQFLSAAVVNPPESCEALLSQLGMMNIGRVSIVRPPIPQCARCEKYFPTCVRLQCDHWYCNECLAARLVESSNAPADVSCGICNKKMGLAVVESGLPLVSEDVRRLYFQWSDSQLTGQCPFCNAEFPILKRKKGSMRPYDLKCVCKKRFCTYCGLRGGHKIVLFRRKCYVFEQRALQLP